MAEPLEIVAAIEALLGGAAPRSVPLVKPHGPGPLAGKRVLVTSGPTHEPIDPVRYIANRSSGKQGHAIARAAAEAGAEVTLVSGPGRHARPARRRDRRRSRPRARCWTRSRRRCRPTSRSSPPPSPTGGSPRPAHGEDQEGRRAPPALALVENPDILATVARRAARRPALVVGFAAETENVVEHARAKLARKGCDLIVANDVSPGRGVMGGERQHRPSRHRGRRRDLADPRQGRGGAAPRRPARRAWRRGERP